MAASPKWTKKEIKLLKEGQNPPNRTPSAIKIMKRRLGIVKYRVPKWTPEHKKELVRLLEEGKSTKEISQILPYTQRSIQKEIVRQRIPHKTCVRFKEIEKLYFENFLREKWQQRTPKELVELWNIDQGRNGRTVNERKVVVYLKKLGLKIPRDEVLKIVLMKKLEKECLQSQDLTKIRLRRVRIMRQRMEQNRNIWTGMPETEENTAT